MEKGIIFDIKEFTVHDGPGIRITVFFKGCPLRCQWCHNPEGLSIKPELMVRESSCIHCGKCREGCEHEECKSFDRCSKVCPLGLIKVSGMIFESRELATNLKKHKDFLEMNKGGITLSGGEPLFQPEFLIDLLKELKPLHTTVETSGYGSQPVFRHVIELADLILFDIKHTDPHEHRFYTGVDNKLIMENLYQLIKSEKRFIARVPLIPGINDSVENMENTAVLLKNAPGLERVELMPYNPFAGAKYPMIGKEYYPPFDEKAEVHIFNEVFEKQGIKYSVL